MELQWQSRGKKERFPHYISSNGLTVKTYAKKKLHMIYSNHPLVFTRCYGCTRWQQVFPLNNPIENTKTTSMEDDSTGVFEKIKNI